MKKIALFGSLSLAIVVVISLAAAMNFGEKSNIYVSGEVVVPEMYLKQAERSSTLFIVMYDMDSPRPMPYGAMKLRLGDGKSSKIPFFVTKERIMTMVENQPPPKRLRVKARLDLDGVAGRDQPGDLTGEASNVYLGSEGVTIEIDKLIQK